MGGKSRLSVLLIALLISCTFSAISSAQSSARSSGVDLRPTSIEFSYTDSTNQTNYQMFSSNHPIVNFNRPKNLYVVDGMLGVEIQISATIENQGNTASGTFDVVFRVLHDEFDDFELFNNTVSGNSISAGGSDLVSTTWRPDYSGNHTLQVISTPVFVSDDDPGDDVLNRHITIGYHYDNCIDLSAWTIGTQWGTSTDTSTSHGQSCHIGNGQSSSYSNNLGTEMVMPRMDFSDGVQSPNRISGISFYYSGGAASGDTLSIHVTEKTGGWTQLATITGVVDNNFLDGSNNWQTFSFAVDGYSSPLIPIDPARHLHANTQFKFRFDSDASGQDIGYYIDDIVVIYDQKPRISEFGWDISGVTGNSGYAGEWSSIAFEVTNTGNLTDRFIPSVSGLPSDWIYHFTHSSGGSVNIQNGVELLPGESRWINLNLQSDVNDTSGNFPYQMSVTSKTHSTVSDVATTSFQILPGRQPEIRPADSHPICAVGSTCGISVEVANTGEANDIFDLVLSEKNLPAGWNIQLDWNQPSKIFVRAGTSEFVSLSVTVPSDAIPDSTGTMWLEATSVNQTSKSDRKVITVAAGMVSEAEIKLDSLPPETLDPGETLTITYRLWNNASRQDIFQIELGTVTGAPTWTVELSELPPLPVNSGSSISFEISITAPASAQAGDLGPMIRPKAVSQKSGQEIMGEQYTGLRAGVLEDISVSIISDLDRIIPGEVMIVEVELVNDGNGDAVVTCTSPGLPDTWESWMMENGYNTSGIELSAAFDLSEVGELQMAFMSPANESSGEIVNITISCSAGAEDLTPHNNIVYVDAIVAKRNLMRLELEKTSDSATVSGDINLNASIFNVGNSYDSTIRVKIQVQSSPAMEFSGVFGRVDGKGGIYGIDEWIDIPMDFGNKVGLVTQLTVPNDAPLDSRITVTYILESNRTEDSMETQTKSALFIVNNRSEVLLEWPIIAKDSVFPNDESVDILVNLTSRSTFDETVIISADIPKGWNLSCGENSVNGETTVVLKSSSGSRVDEKLLCTLSRESGPYSGEIVFRSSSNGGIKNTLEITWEQKSTTEEKYLSTQNMMYGGIGGIVLLVVLLIAKQIFRDKEQLDYEEKSEVEIEQTTQQPIAQMNETPEQKHAREVAEYQRKVAEYEAQMAAWEASRVTPQEDVKPQESLGPPATMGPPASVQDTEEVAETMDVSKAFDVL